MFRNHADCVDEILAGGMHGQPAIVWTAAVNLQGGFGEGIFRSNRTMRLSAA
jgi:hypothetical protein